jgi:hypothetical protein
MICHPSVVLVLQPHRVPVNRRSRQCLHHMPLLLACPAHTVLPLRLRFVLHNRFLGRLPLVHLNVPYRPIHHSPFVMCFMTVPKQNPQYSPSRTPCLHRGPSVPSTGFRVADFRLVGTEIATSSRTLDTGGFSTLSFTPLPANTSSSASPTNRLSGNPASSAAIFSLVFNPTGKFRITKVSVVLTVAL